MPGHRYRMAKKWTRPILMDRLTKRSKNVRIRDDILYFREKTEGSIIYAWDTFNGKTVVMTRKQWQESDPAIKFIEACILLNISDITFRRYMHELGIIPKRGRLGDIQEDMPVKAAQYFSIEDLCLISDSIRRKHKAQTSSYELRELFRIGYISYKQTSNGEWVPTWDESIF